MTGTSQEDGLAPISGERGRADQSGLDARLKEPAVPVSMGNANELACILAANDLLDRFLHFLKRQPVTARGQRIRFCDLPRSRPDSSCRPARARSIRA